MKILVTGGNGMVGRNILEHPKATQHILLSPSSAELNLRDYNAVDAYLKKNQPDFNQWEISQIKY